MQEEESGDGRKEMTTTQMTDLTLPVVPTPAQIEALTAASSRFIDAFLPRLLQKWLESPEGQAQIRAAFEACFGGDPRPLLAEAGRRNNGTS
jgi:hypothetical protein